VIHRASVVPGATLFGLTRSATFRQRALITKLDRLESVADVRELTDCSPPANSGA